VGTGLKYISTLDDSVSETTIGRKSSSLARVKKAGFITPDSFCINSTAYFEFINQNKLQKLIDVELGRKSIEEMRWEELWDCGLRIRSQILKAAIPDQLIKEIKEKIPPDFLKSGVAIRSSSLQEDMKNASFAGLYDSYLNCNNFLSIFDAILKVWASLWSDRALLYRKEINLDSENSAMCILAQRMIQGEYSGVGFSTDPNDRTSDHLMIEIVPGLCSGLVDGSVEPINYILDRSNLEVIDSKERIEKQHSTIEINHNIVRNVGKILLELEDLFKHPVDVEWSSKKGRITLLQVRPISYRQEKDEKRSWYLTLTPNQKKLSSLADEVEKELIPKLKYEGNQLALEKLTPLSNPDLAEKITSRLHQLHYWREVYKEKFIPLAHGVREFGQYYNDNLKPQDPYEFIYLLKSCPRIAGQRFKALKECSATLVKSKGVSAYLTTWLAQSRKKLTEKNIIAIKNEPNGKSFCEQYNLLKKKYFDIAINSACWKNRDDVIITLLLNYSTAKSPLDDNLKEQQLLNQYLLTTDNASHAKALLKIGRLSWSLRDDDNLLLSKIESQLILALNQAKERLISLGRLQRSVKINEEDAHTIAQALTETSSKPIRLTSKERNHANNVTTNIKPRQIKGQPAVPGTVSGIACRISSLDDIKKFTPGSIILCRAVDPNMTHLIPLSSGIIEQRGGMLIHGVIIARELGIPCVNGVGQALDSVNNGDRLTIDGTLGIIILEKKCGDINSNNESTD